MDFDTVITGHSLSMTQGCTSPCAHTPAGLSQPLIHSHSHTAAYFCIPTLWSWKCFHKVQLWARFHFKHLGRYRGWVVLVRGSSAPFSKASLLLSCPAGLGLFVRRWGSELTCQQHLAITAEGPQGTQGIV